MPDDTNPSLDVTARLDASGVVTGAGTAEKAISGIAVATTEADQVAKLYSSSVTVAERALVILGAEAGKATANLVELDAAMDLAQGEAVKAAEANAAYATSLQASAAEVIAAGEAQSELGTISALTARNLTRLGIEQTAVAASAAEMAISMEVAAQAMIQIERARLAETVKDARIAMEALTDTTAAQTVATEADAVANELDAEALAQRAIMMRRTSDGLVDLAMGGRRAVQGVADLQYVATAAFPELSALLAVLGGLAIAYEVWESASRKAAEGHHSDVGKIKEDVKDLTIVQIAYKEILEKTIEAENALESSQARQIATAEKLLSIAEKRAKLEFDSALEKARQQELVDLGNATDENEKNRIRENFKATESDIKSGSDIATARAGVTSKQGEIGDRSKELSFSQESRQENERRLEDLERNVANARASLVALNVGIGDDLLPDKKDKDAAVKAAEKKVDDLEHDYTSVHTPEEIQSARDELTRLKQLIQTVEEYPDEQKKLSAATQAAAKKMEELQDKLSILNAELDLAQKGLEISTRKAVDSQVESNSNRAKAAQSNPEPLYTKPVDDALNLAVRAAGGNTGLNSGDHLRQISEVKTHIQDAMKAHQDISGFVLELISMMQAFKIGSQRDRDKILDALSSFKNSNVGAAQ